VLRTKHCPSPLPTPPYSFEDPTASILPQDADLRLAGLPIVPPSIDSWHQSIL
jgi:hypothetical protein